MYTAIEDTPEEICGGIDYKGCGLASVLMEHGRLEARGDMAHLDNFALAWELSPPKRNPDDVGFDELEEDPADEDLEEDDEEEEEDEEEAVEDDDEEDDVDDEDEEDLEEDEDLDEDDLEDDEEDLEEEDDEE